MDPIPPFFLPNGDGEHGPERWHHGIVVEKTGEDNEASKKLRTMHLYSRSVNILYGRIPCSEDWRQYHLGSWMKFTLRNGKYFSTSPIHPDHAPYLTRLSPVNETIVQVYVRFFLVPDLIKHTKMSRDRRKYFKMWSPEMGGVYVDGDSITEFGMLPDGMYSGWVQSSLDLNFAPNDVDEDGWPYDRSLYWQLVYEANGDQKTLKKESPDDYASEVDKLLKETKRQALALNIAKKDKPMLDKLAEEFNRTDYNSMLLLETERITTPRIQVENQALQPCFIAQRSDDLGIMAPLDGNQVGNALIQSGGSSLMSGFGFAAISPAIGQGNFNTGSGDNISISPQPIVPQNKPVVFSGHGFSYDLPEPHKTNNGAFSDTGPTMTHEIRNGGSPGQGFAFLNPPQPPARQQNVSIHQQSPCNLDGEQTRGIPGVYGTAPNFRPNSASGGGFRFGSDNLQPGGCSPLAPRPQPGLQVTGSELNGFGEINSTNAPPSCSGGFGFAANRHQSVNGNGAAHAASRPFPAQNTGSVFDNLSTTNNHVANASQAFHGMNISDGSGPRTIGGKQYGGFSKNFKQ